ncbi:late embryogenesis abundant protein At1g64065-like [Coffea eugenioides]|uniref:late embryogenesis abundant protein At1g64065-like n=1 Tax=Coffea eugenioides TaxID=49369 RepID=UPI000F610BE5|nr:late embryogenesis abundant protein At1g64065-like [Coffea eugenioides]
MAENGEQKVYGSATVNPYGRVDEEVASLAQKDERRKKRMKCFAYVAAFAVFQTAVILVFALVVMKVRTPKFRVRSAAFEDFQVSTLTTNASFSTSMITELSAKNPNFGSYKYQDSTVNFFYQNYKVGEAVVPKGKANFRSTKKFTVSVDLNSANVPGNVLGSELSQHAWIPLTSRATLKGKVTLMLMFKKNKSTSMDCTMNLNTSSRQLQELSCK